MAEATSVDREALEKAWDWGDISLMREMEGLLQSVNRQLDARSPCEPRTFAQ
jgi:hypothetical protein